MSVTSFVDEVYGDEPFLGQHAAQRALQPIRDLHKPMELKQSVFNGDGTFIGQRVSGVVCEYCYSRPSSPSHCDYCDADDCEGTHGPSQAFSWPCSTARLAYSSTEVTS